MLMNLTDTLMMARLSPEALAGGGLGAAGYSFVAIFHIGVITWAPWSPFAMARAISTAPRLDPGRLWLAWLMALAAAVMWNEAGTADVPAGRNQRASSPGSS